MSFYLAIISPLDSPLFELFLPSPSRQSSIPNSAGGPSTAAPTNSARYPSWSSHTGSGDGYSLPPTPNATSGGQANGQGGQGGVDRSMFQMIAFKSLDGVEEVMESTGSLYLRNVDKYNEWTVSAYLAMGVKFVLIHDQKNDDGIRMFFNDLWELWVKVLLNPFHTVNTPIRNNAFEGRVRAAAKRYL